MLSPPSFLCLAIADDMPMSVKQQTQGCTQDQCARSPAFSVVFLCLFQEVCS